MPRPLKVFEFDARVPESKKYGRHGQVMVYVAATSQAAVAKLMGVKSAARLNNFHEAIWGPAVRLCPTKPLTCFVRGINDYGNEKLDEIPVERLRR